MKLDSNDFPNYDSIKQVGAMLVTKVGPPRAADGLCPITLEDGRFLWCEEIWLMRRTNTNDVLTAREKAVGMYLVVYRDGYTSLSPAGEFEDGYVAKDRSAAPGVEAPGNTFRRQYRQLTALEQCSREHILDKAEALWLAIDAASGDPRCLALAKTKAEEAVMWANKGVSA